MLIDDQQFIWNLGFALPECECVTIATFMCIYAVAAALAVLGDTVSPWQISYAAIARGGTHCGRGDLFSVSESFFSPAFRKGSRLDRDKPLDLSGKIRKNAAIVILYGALEMTFTFLHCLQIDQFTSH